MRLSQSMTGKFDEAKNSGKVKNAGAAKNAKAGRIACELCGKADLEIADMLKKETSDVLDHVLCESSNLMKNAYARSDN